MNKKGQSIEAQFNWIYVLIAGVVILLFFIAIVVKQQFFAEKKLSAEVITKLNGIFKAAGVSTDTTNVIKIPKTELGFVCDEDYSEFNIKEAGVRIETTNQPIFAPEKLETRKLVTWTRPMNLPYPVGDILLVGSPDITYVIVTDPNGASAQIAENLLFEIPEQYGFLEEDDSNLKKHLGQVRYILTKDSQKNQLDFRKGITAVYLGKKITFYDELGVGKTTSRVVDETLSQIPSLAAIFSNNKENYECNMKKVLKRANFITQIQEKRIDKLKSNAGNGFCISSFNNALDKIPSIKQELLDCIDSTNDFYDCDLSVAVNFLASQKKSGCNVELY